MNVELALLAIALIVVLAGDTAACIQPIQYIRDDLERLGCTESQIKVIPAVKGLALAGLIIGLWVPAIGVAACVGMLVYFGFAFWFHARAKDPVAKYLPAAGFTALVAAALIFSYIPGL